MSVLLFLIFYFLSFCDILDHKGPQKNDETRLIIPKQCSREGDSVIRLLNQSTEVECDQDLYAKNGRFL
jgi:hypothetical protein